MNATGVTAGPAESNGRLLLGIWRDSLHLTCGLTACTPGSAPGPTLGNEYGKNFTFYVHSVANARIRTAEEQNKTVAGGGAKQQRRSVANAGSVTLTAEGRG